MNEERKEARGRLYLIPVRQIVNNTNPREPVSTELQKAGYGVWQSEPGLPPLWQLATSESAEDRARYVRLLKEKDPVLAAFAANLLAVGQLEPVEVRDNGRRSDGASTYTLVFGCRRCLAILFNWCVLGRPKEPVVEAKLTKGNEVTLMHRAISENIRKDPNPIEVARSMQYALNAGETREEIAERYGCSVTTISNRLALLDLPLDVQRKIADGRLKPTKALEQAQPEASAEREDQPRRLKLRPRREIEERLAACPADSVERAVLAWVLQTEDQRPCA